MVQGHRPGTHPANGKTQTEQIGLKSHKSFPSDPLPPPDRTGPMGTAGRLHAARCSTGPVGNAARDWPGPVVVGWGSAAEAAGVGETTGCTSAGAAASPIADRSLIAARSEPNLRPHAAWLPRTGRRAPRRPVPVTPRSR